MSSTARNVARPLVRHLARPAGNALGHVRHPTPGQQAAAAPVRPGTSAFKTSRLSTSVPMFGPVETSIRTKLTETLKPLHLEVTNDSHLHAHHAAMRARGGGDGESHFTVEVVSAEFEGKRQMQRHRLIYATLQSELDAGLHALVIKARTPKEAGMNEDAGTAVEAPPAAGNESLPAGP